MGGIGGVLPLDFCLTLVITLENALEQNNKKERSSKEKIKKRKKNRKRMKAMAERADKSSS